MADPSPPGETSETSDIAPEAASEFVVNPFTVSGKVDYDKLLEQFGSQPIDQALLDRMEKLTGKPVHRWLRRGYFYSHRDLNRILDAYEKGESFYLYTGRGPSSDALHFGHLIPFLFTKYLQDAFNVPLVIQMTGDEKFLWKDMKYEDAVKYTHENAKDIIALGFDPKKTFLFSNLDYMGQLYPTVLRIQKQVNANRVQKFFGFTMQHNIGQFAFPAIQAAPSFCSAFPHIFGNSKKVQCLIPCAIDQDPYFRLTRDIAPPLKFRKPALIHSKFFPSLLGIDSKMSASNDKSAIFLTDTPKQVRKKINCHAFSGGKETREEQEKYGADISVDISVMYLEFFLEDDAELADIKEKYAAGKMLTGQVKKRLGDIMAELVKEHQEARKKVTNAMVAEFMAVRKIQFPCAPMEPTSAATKE